MTSAYSVAEDACPHCWDETSLRTVPNGVNVPKDDCAYCCRTSLHDGGILVCANCFIGVCPQHAARHHALTQHSMFVAAQQLPPAPAPDVTDTNQLGVAPPAEFEYKLLCFPCKQEHTPGVGVTFDSFCSIVNTISVAVGDSIQMQAWYSSRRECVHIQNLQQTQPCKYPPGAPPTSAHPCEHCAVTENNWMCLICGAIGCPRAEAGGNGHAKLHFSQTKHCIVLKLGTATPEGCDMYCYECDDEVKDTRLAAHLAHFGIDLAKSVKSSKSLGEMEYERTMLHDFSKITESGTALAPVFGPAYTGLKNFGNTCYMASVLQCLFSLRAFQDRFFQHTTRVPGKSHRENCRANPYECHECQVERLADGMLSGDFSDASIPDCQRGITPRSFKKLFTKGHPDFSTGMQQDAAEFMTFILQEISRRVPVPAGCADPTKCMDFVLEERSQCSGCNIVKYARTVQNSLSLTLPVKPPTDTVTGALTEEEIDTRRPKTTLDETLATFLFPTEVICVCPGCSKSCQRLHTNRMATFPDVFAVHVRREYFDKSFLQVRKLDAYIDVPQEINLERMRGRGPQGGEILMAAESSRSAAAKPDIAVDDVALALVVSMGIDAATATWALQSTSNNVERAIDFVFSHPEGPPAPAHTSPAPTPAAVEVSAATNGSPTYALSAMISHIGSSAQTGHYVCHIRNPQTQQWVLFNDEKVAMSQLPPFRMASVYFYTRTA